jgi:EAL and modified HD-GYP domain-containing signal transduction protein
MGNMTEVLLHRQPIVTGRQELAGYDLRLLSPHGELAAAGGIAALLTGEEDDEGFFQRLPTRFALADCMQVEAEQAPAPGRFVLGLRADGTVDNLPALASRCKAAGFSLCLNDPLAGAWPAELLDQAGYFRMSMKSLAGTLKKTGQQLRRHSAKQILAEVDTRAEFEQAQAAGCDLIQGYFFLEPLPGEAQAVNPSYNTIVGLMKLTQDNAPIGKIEELLKRDAALSYRLLRYINSVGFGLSCEIHSFKHAVTVLGYLNLHRWLALLLVTAARQTGSPALVTSAVLRGRLAELLGESLFEKKDRDNLFIVGAFSLLPVILHTPMEKIADAISLPEAVTDALFHHTGPYGPLLQLVELTERLDQPGKAEQACVLAMSLGLSLDVVNRAQMRALTWAETLIA